LYVRVELLNVRICWINIEFNLSLRHS